MRRGGCRYAPHAKGSGRCGIGNCPESHLGARTRPHRTVAGSRHRPHEVPPRPPPPPPRIWMHLVNGTGNSPSPGQPTPGVVKQDKSSGGSVDTTKTHSDPQRVRMSRGERPLGAAKVKRPNTEALYQAPPPPPRSSSLCDDRSRAAGSGVQACGWCVTPPLHTSPHFSVLCRVGSHGRRCPDEGLSLVWLGPVSGQSSQPVPPPPPPPPHRGQKQRLCAEGQPPHSRQSKCVFPTFGDKQRTRFGPQNPNKCAHPEQRISPAPHLLSPSPQLQSTVCTLSTSIVHLSMAPLHLFIPALNPIHT